MFVPFKIKHVFFVFPSLAAAFKPWNLHRYLVYTWVVYSSQREHHNLCWLHNSQLGEKSLYQCGIIIKGPISSQLWSSYKMMDPYPLSLVVGEHINPCFTKWEPLIFRTGDWIMLTIPEGHTYPKQWWSVYRKMM